jgi:uncharacterized membrane protein
MPKNRTMPKTTTADTAKASASRRKPDGTHCAITGQALPKGDMVMLHMLRPALAERIRADHPGLGDNALVSRQAVDDYRSRYITELLAAEHGESRALDRQVARSIAKQDTVAMDTDDAFDDKRTVGEHLADIVASFGGSWSFIILFGVIIIIWMTINVAIGDPKAFDPYPFILLNLVLSCLAALQAPVIMMSQKRQEAKDRLRSQSDYRVNLKAELEIRHLHEKMDHLLVRQWERLAEIQQLQVELLQEIRESATKSDQHDAARKATRPKGPA